MSYRNQSQIFKKLLVPIRIIADNLNYTLAEIMYSHLHWQQELYFQMFSRYITNVYKKQVLSKSIYSGTHLILKSMEI